MASFDRLKAEFGESTDIRGRNTGDVFGVRFDRLSSNNREVSYSDDEVSQKQLAQAKVLEERTMAIFDEAEQTTVKLLAEVDGKVVIPPHTSFHRMVQDMIVFKNKSIGGLLAREWFGILESEGEGRYCVFLNTTMAEEEKKGNARSIMNKKSQTPTVDQCVLFFDNTNPIMQRLLRTDFFEYQRVKTEEPEKLHELYTEEDIKIFEELILPISPSSKNFHANESKLTYDWRAIPGGVPRQLINGICIHSSRQDILDRLPEISRMFPNATIFDEHRTVLMPAMAKRQSQSELID